MLFFEEELRGADLTTRLLSLGGTLQIHNAAIQSSLHSPSLSPETPFADLRPDLSIRGLHLT